MTEGLSSHPELCDGSMSTLTLNSEEAFDFFFDTVISLSWMYHD